MANQDDIREELDQIDEILGDDEKTAVQVADKEESPEEEPELSEESAPDLSSAEVELLGDEEEVVELALDPDDDSLGVDEFADELEMPDLAADPPAVDEEPIAEEEPVAENATPAEEVVEEEGSPVVETPASETPAPAVEAIDIPVLDAAERKLDADVAEEAAAAESVGPDPDLVKAALRELPQVDQLVGSFDEVEGVGDRPRELVANETRLAIEVIRERIQEGEMTLEEVTAYFESATFTEDMRRRLKNPPYHAKVLNATGVVLHSGMGRAPLCSEAKDAILASAGYCRLEMNEDTGDSSRREEAVKDLLIELTGAESALMVNNNAAATLLALNTLAAGLEVLVSRAEMVEIGSSFRMPEVMRYAGCRLVDVGCTNRTYLRDYQAAATEKTALIFKVHTSNYRISGFTSHQEIAELVALGKELELPVLADLGSGLLWEDPFIGLEDEPLVKTAVAAGTTITCFSGDKLLGGCQGGLLVGKKEAIEACRRNPLYRAVRSDKLSLAAMEATLRVYASKEKVAQRIPALRYLHAPMEDLRRNARRLKSAIDRKHLDGLGSFLLDGTSRVGSGSAPDQDIPTRLVALKPPGAAEDLLHRLRQAPTPVFARIHDDNVILDPRTLEDDEFSQVAEAVEWALAT